MANRKRPEPEAVEPLLAPLRQDAKMVARHQRALAAARASRDQHIREALAAEVAPTHAQIADAAGLERGQIGRYSTT